MRMQQVREAREARSPEAQVQVREAKVTDHLRSRGDMVDRTGGRSAKVAGEQGVQAQRGADRVQKQLTAKQDRVRNCSPTDDSCGSSSRAAQAGSQAAADRAASAAARQQRNDVQKMVEKMRAEKLREKIMRQMCERHANTCAETL